MSDAGSLPAGQVARVWPLAGSYGLLWLGLSLVPLSWTAGYTDGWRAPPMPQPVVYGAISLVLLVLALRAFRIGVRITDRGVTIRNVTSTRRVRREEIDGFGEERADRWPGEDTCLIRRRDGSTVAAACLQPPVDIDRWTERAIARLNATLSERRGGAAPEPVAP